MCLAWVWAEHPNVYLFQSSEDFRKEVHAVGKVCLLGHNLNIKTEWDNLLCFSTSLKKKLAG